MYGNSKIRTIRLHRRTLATAHAAFFAVAGAWPIVSIRTFEAVTGPKADKWLVKTVGTLITVAGVIGLDAARRDRVRGETIASLTGISAALGYISFHYARTGRISPVYYLDAATEAAILTAWAAVLLRERAGMEESAAPIAPRSQSAGT